MCLDRGLSYVSSLRTCRCTEVTSKRYLCPIRILLLFMIIFTLHSTQFNLCIWNSVVQWPKTDARFEIFTAVKIHILVLWVVTPCNEELVSYHIATRRHNPEEVDFNLTLIYAAWRGLGIFLFTTASRTALGPTQPPMQCVPGAFSLEVKRQSYEADHSPPSNAEVEEWVGLYFHSPNTPSWRGAQLKVAQEQLYFYLYQSFI
jgi:hypothetical protein